MQRPHVFFFISMLLVSTIFGDYGDYGNDDNGLIPEPPVQIPSGEYYICVPASKFTARRCLTFYRPRNESKNCAQDKQQEEAKERFLYPSKDFASRFRLEYYKNSTSTFTLTCDTCENEFHGPNVHLVDHHLEFVSKTPRKSGYIGKFAAYQAASRGQHLFLIRSTRSHLICKWWHISMFRKRIEIDPKFRANEFEFYQSLDTNPVVVF